MCDVLDALFYSSNYLWTFIFCLQYQAIFDFLGPCFILLIISASQVDGQKHYIQLGFRFSVGLETPAGYLYLAE